MAIPTYHLRRVNPKPHLPEELILLGEITKFGRNADNVDVVLTSAVYSNMISRDHAIITGRVDPHTHQIIGYKIRDNSLNGTYIDDKRVKDEMTLHDSCVIKFGHMNGAAIKAGVAAPQANAEFSFVFEKCSLPRKYCGWEGHDRRRTVVCTGDGKPMTETGEDYKTKRKPPIRDPVSSTTAPTSAPFPMQHAQPIPPPLAQPPAIFNSFPTDRGSLYQLMTPWNALNGPTLNPMRQQPMVGMRPNGQYQAVPPRGGPYPLPQPPSCPPLNASMERQSESSTVPIRSPPVECDSSVPSPPKTGADTRTGQADSSSQHSPRRVKDDDEDTFSVPDSPPRAPRPIDVPGRSVTNSPAPPSPRPVEKVETPKEEKSKTVLPKKPTNPGKAPKSGGGGEKRKNNEVSRLLDDLTEGSFMLQQIKMNEGGTGSERRKTIGKKSAKRAVSKNKLHRQLSSASSDEDSDDDELRGVPVRRTSTSTSRPSMVGKKASTAVGTSKGAVKKGGRRSRGQKEESEESDPYEETDDSEGEMKNGKRKVAKKTSLANAKKEKVASKKMRKKKKKGSDDSSESDSEGFEDNGEKFYDTEDTKCEAVECQLPGGKKVCWVACDGCGRWFHSFCQFGVNQNYTGTKYFCGCGEPPMKKTKKKKKKN